MLGTIATSVFATCAAVSVVALAFALYAFVEPYLGRAGAAAVVAGSAALIIGLGGALIALSMGSSKPKKPAPPPPGRPEALVERAFDFVREKPVVAIVAALAAGFMAVRNPGYLGTALRSFLEGHEPPKR